LLGLLALTAAVIIRDNRPPAPRPATAPATEISAERALEHLRVIAQRPHPPGTADHDRVKAYIVSQITALGLVPEVQEATAVGTRYQVAGHIANVVTRLPGTKPGGPAVLLMAHYDGVGAGPAASDDGAGSAALLETVRALRAGPPLEHDVIVLFTDGEEAGLLGAAAFVREHRYAKDVQVTLNFEARGTGGRSVMFETGRGNLDVVRALRTAGDVSATSLSVTVYRILPNDTDLSEVAILDRPALNFAFADQVENYHTTHDDVAHLDPGSLQHHGVYALALARTFGNGPLPRPTTGDAVFFDFPVIGLVLYPEGWARPLAVIAAVLVILTVVRLARRERRWIRDLVLGVIGTVLATVLGGAAAFGAIRLINRFHGGMPNGGSPAWRGIYGAVLAVLGWTFGALLWALARRWASRRGAHVGALLVWAVLAVVAAWKVPGASFLCLWPLVGGWVIAWVALGPEQPRHSTVSLWIGTVVVVAILAPLIYAIGVVLLGVTSPAGIAIGALVPLVAWLVAPQFDALAAEHRWRLAFTGLGAAVVLFGIGAATVRSSASHPGPSLLIYAFDADGQGAWLATGAGLVRPGSWGAKVLGGSAEDVREHSDSSTAAAPPPWIAGVLGGRVPMRATPVARLPLAGPAATVLADTTVAEQRIVTVRVVPAPGTVSIGMRMPGTPVSAASIDGRPIDPSRYRRPSAEWTLAFAAPPDTGFTVSLTVAKDARPRLELTASSPGLPAIPGVTIPPRPDDLVPTQTGDITVSYRNVALSGSSTPIAPAR
jgi:hypothetical protein